ncbi:serine/threonine-protein kinase [Streptomonospora litoralis]|uniref:Serine/threonine-protein kinase AfsK n=1 Tax=Streptomonospora litoralis TaxID=2498135 RepID=A0A4V0ZKD7_9ACTN|nr:serine/threonine-protein kinase [Streptomonospora litoralis]QBI56622.1 Serine/threonine-protein kinase AfsK [Streptomonospora litoralis]
MSNPTPLPPLHSSDPRAIAGYELLGRIGAGGMGVVYAALAPEGGRAALKVIRGEFDADPEFRERFAREIALMRRVRAASTVPVLAAGTTGDKLWYATPYVSGATLAGHVDRSGPLDPARLRALALGLAEAVAAIHAAGVVHRDLKPANVILAPDGPKVLDFGIARAVDESAITRTGGLVGSPGWIAPEGYRGVVGPEADVFAWGALVAFAATGRRPFGTGSVEALTYRVLNEAPDIAGVAPELAGIVERALAKDPAQRPDGAALLREIAAGAGAAAPAGDDPATAVTGVLHRDWTAVENTPGLDWSRAERTARRRRRTRNALLAGAAACALVLAVGAGTVAGTSYRENGTPLPWAADGVVEGTASQGAGQAGQRGGAPDRNDIQRDNRIIREVVGCEECTFPVDIVPGLRRDGEPVRLVFAESPRGTTADGGADLFHLTVALVRDSDDEVLAHNYDRPQPNMLTFSRNGDIADLMGTDDAGWFYVNLIHAPVEQGAQVPAGRIVKVDPNRLDDVEEFGGSLRNTAFPSNNTHQLAARDLDGDGVYEIPFDLTESAADGVLRVWHSWDPRARTYAPAYCSVGDFDGGSEMQWSEPANVNEEPCSDLGNVGVF